MIASTVAWLEDQAWARVQRLRGHIDSEDYTERLRATAELIHSGAFSETEPAFHKAIMTAAGQRYLWFLMLQPANQGMSEELANRIYTAEQELVLARMRSANNTDPTGGPPAQAPASEDGCEVPLPSLSRNSA